MIPARAPRILAWARSAVAPVGGAFKALPPHGIAAPVLRELLARAGVAVSAVDAVVAGNALGAGGNPARMLALAADLQERCSAYTVDTQCCAGLDAVALAAGLLAGGNAEVAIAGGVEAWSRAPIRQHRPMRPGEPAVAYERPAFAPDPERDPDMLLSAARYAARQGYSRADQDAYAVLAHARAFGARSRLAGEIVPVAGLAHDAYPRVLSAQRVARMPAAAIADESPASRQASPGAGPVSGDPARWALSPPAISPKADGAAFVLLATDAACRRLGLRPRAAWLGSASVGAAPEMPLLAAAQAARELLARLGLCMADMAAVELHDAFAAQALGFRDAFGLAPERLNRHGGGLARGHPIGASAAIALVRLLADLDADEAAGAAGLAAAAGAGGLGAAAVVARL